MGLIDELIQGISKEVNKVQIRSQEMLNAYNLGQEIRDLEQQKTDRLASIGRSICDKYERQINVTEESLQEQCKEISTLEKDIAGLQIKLENLKKQAAPEKDTSRKD